MDLPPGPRWPAPVQAAATVRLPFFLNYCHARFGDRFTVRLGRFGTYLYLANPADIRTVFRGEDDAFHAGEANAPLLGRVLGGSSVLCTDGDVHRRQRRQMAGPFRGESVARLIPIMAEVAAANVETWPGGHPFPVLPRARILTLDIILRAVLGVEETRPELRAMLSQVADLSPLRMAYFLFPKLERVGLWAKYARWVSQAQRLLREEIRRCRRDRDLVGRNDVLAMLVRDSDMDDDELRDQMMTLLMAGHETTATALAWTFERLVRHPVVLAKAQRAAEDGDDAYLDAVAAEALRARPVVPYVTRLAKRDTTVGEADKAINVPAGTFVDPALWLVLRSAVLYPHPEAFRPERFVGERPDPLVWLPFGGGTRRCLGAAFALAEMRVVLATVLRRVELTTTTAPGERVRIRHVTLAPARGGRIEVRRSQAFRSGRA